MNNGSSNGAAAIAAKVAAFLGACSFVILVFLLMTDIKADGFTCGRMGEPLQGGRSCIAAKSERETKLNTALAAGVILFGTAFIISRSNKKQQTTAVTDPLAQAEAEAAAAQEHARLAQQRADELRKQAGQ